MVDTEWFRARTWAIIYSDRAADDIVGEGIAARCRREPGPVRVVLEDVVAYVAVAQLHHRQSSVGVVVDVVACRKCNMGCRCVRPVIYPLRDTSCTGGTSPTHSWLHSVTTFTLFLHFFLVY